MTSPRQESDLGRFNGRGAHHTAADQVDVLGLVEHLLVVADSTLLSTLRAGKINQVQLAAGWKHMRQLGRKRSRKLSVPVLRLVAVTYTVRMACERLEACHDQHEQPR